MPLHQLFKNTPPNRASTGMTCAMNMKSRRAKIPWICGILATIVPFTCILLAIFSYHAFSWTENALSDLGVISGVTSVLFNSGLIAGGLLAFAFAAGLYITLKRKVVGRAGASVFAVATLAMIAIGVFPENLKPMHYYASVTFFALFPLSMLVISVAFAAIGKLKIGLFTFLMAIFAAIVWAAQFSLRPFSGVAIPETLSALSVSAWSIVLSFTMLKDASHLCSWQND